MNETATPEPRATILIVDDTPANLGVMVECLEGKNYRVLVAQDGEEGLERAALVRPDLILLDVMMPGLDGFAVCRRLKASEVTHDIPVIFMTALADIQDKLAAFAAGGVDYVTKPLQINEVATRVQTHLELNALRRQLSAQNVELRQTQGELEQRVESRTEALAKTSAALESEIEERKRAEGELKTSAEQLRDLYNKAPCGYHSLDAGGVFVQINDTQLKWLGYPREELVGKRSLTDFLTPEGCRSFDSAFRHIKERGWVRDVELQLVRRDGSLLPVLLSATAVTDASGGFVMARVTLRAMNNRAELFERHYFRFEGHRLAYETLGEGPPVVLMHGILLDSLLFRELGARFADEGFRVILLDLLGHGRSDKTFDPKDYRADFYADQVIALLDHLGIARALVGGASLGSLVSLHVAARAPQRVAGLFLEMPVMEWSMPWAALILAPVLLGARFLRFAYNPMTQIMRRLPRPHRLRQQWLGSVMNAMSQQPEIVAAILHGVLVGSLVPPEEQRSRLKVPALIIGHVGDRLHEVRDAHVLSQMLGNARLLEARHVLELRTRPERLWPEIAAFLQEVRAAMLDTSPEVPGPSEIAAPPNDLRWRFERAVETMRSAFASPLQLPNELRLKIYGLYRQATRGDVRGQHPGVLIDNANKRAAYEAWAALKGLSTEEAMRQYLEEVSKLQRSQGRVTPIRGGVGR